MMIYAEKSEAALADHEWKRILETWISQVKQGEKILILPPDITRCYSYAGKITAYLYEKLSGECKVRIMPAVGTHRQMTREERIRFFGAIPDVCFLSHNWKDKDVIEPIAVRLKEVYGEENIFYDSWSIKPGENIIGKMNEGIEKCKYFFFFISNNSLNSSMVNLEWQSALFKSAKEGIKFIPIKIDNCYPPQILISTVYIDMYSY